MMINTPKTGEFYPQMLSLREFLLLQSEHGYGGEQAVTQSQDDGSKLIEFEAGRWKFSDKYFTSSDGRYFIGQEVVFFSGAPLWCVNYQGWVSAGEDPSYVYGFLKEMLRLPDKDFPLRGPRAYRVENLDYEVLSVDGMSASRLQLEQFDVEEMITRDLDVNNGNDALIYRATFSGGLIG